MTYRVYHQLSQSHTIDEVIRPDFINPRDARYFNAFMPLRFRILSPKLLIVAWPNRDLIISALHLMFVTIL
jgi:hypothetical protein